MPDSTDLIRSYLADRDFPCPGCTYNLRGVEQPVCPECGRAIELTIARPGRSRGYLLFVLLALGWVLIAGTMNGVRSWNTVRYESLAGQTMFTFLGSPGGPTRISRSAPFTLTPRSGSTTILTPGGTTTITLPQTNITSNSTSSTRLSFGTGGSLTTTFSSRTVTASPSPTRNWSAVSRQSWIVLGWWAGLALAALVWLTLCLIRRRRFDAERPPRLLMAAAWSLFTLYAGYHALMFTRELLT